MARRQSVWLCTLAVLAIALVDHAGAQAPPVKCPISASKVKLDFTEVKTMCVTPAKDKVKEFCDQCSCALFTAFTPALEAGGILKRNQSDVVTEGVNIITACVTEFIAQFVSAGVEVPALVALGNCTYGDEQVPKCLVERVAALTANTTNPAAFRTSTPAANGTATANTTTPAAPTAAANATAPASPAAPNVTASDGKTDDEFAPDTSAQQQIKDAIDTKAPTIAPTPGTIEAPAAPNAPATPANPATPATPTATPTTPQPEATTTPAAQPTPTPAAQPQPEPAPAAAPAATPPATQPAAPATPAPAVAPAPAPAPAPNPAPAPAPAPKSHASSIAPATRSLATGLLGAALLAALL